MNAHIEIDGRSFVLGRDQDLEKVLTQIEEAASSPPAFVTLVGDHQTIRVLMQPTTQVVASVGTVGFVDRDHDPRGTSHDEWEY